MYQLSIVNLVLMLLCCVVSLQSCLSISSESSAECAPCPLTSEHPFLSHRHQQQQQSAAALGTSDGESDQYSTSSSSPVMLDSVSPTEVLPGSAGGSYRGVANGTSHFPWVQSSAPVSHNHLSRPSFSGMH